jgi:hypothetical protein
MTVALPFRRAETVAWFLFRILRSAVSYRAEARDPRHRSLPTMSRTSAGTVPPSTWRLSLLLVVGAAAAGCHTDDSTRADSLVAVLANPTSYEGKVITVRGFVNLEKDGDAIYLGADDYRWAVTANGVWLHMPRCSNRAGEPVHRGYMTVVGNFTTKLHGHADEWVGEIDNIKLCRLVEGLAEEPRPRPTEP